MDKAVAIFGLVVLIIFIIPMFISMIYQGFGDCFIEPTYLIRKIEKSKGEYCYDIIRKECMGLFPIDRYSTLEEAKEQLEYHLESINYPRIIEDINIK